MLIRALDNVNSRRIARSKTKRQEDLYHEQLVYTDKSMVGCYLAVFFKRKLAPRIKPQSLQRCKVKVGNLGATGNKGAVGLRFQLGNQQFIVLNCHLASGRGNDGRRIQQLEQIFAAAFQNNLRNRGMAIENHSQAILMGDLNFRMQDMTREKALDLIKKGEIRQLLEQDALLRAFDKHSTSQVSKTPESKYQDLLFQQFMEGAITFRPTYKLDVRSQEYDTSKKQREPAFCDRILWRRNPDITQLYYQCVDAVDFTDHRPVVAYFQVKIVE